KLADKLKENTQKEANPKELNLQQQKWKNAKTFDFQWKQKKFTYRIAKDKLIEKGDIEEKDKTISESPDKKYAVLIKGYNLYLIDQTKRDTIALSTDGRKDYIYGSSYGWGQVMEGENAIPEPNLNVSWSPDGKKLLTQIMDTRNAERMYLLDESIDSLYRPQLLSYFRGSPGDTTVVHYIPVIYDIP